MARRSRGSSSSGPNTARSSARDSAVPPSLRSTGTCGRRWRFGGSLVVQAGWQWLNGATGTRLRVGFQYFNGKNEQYQFYNDFVEQFGVGIWYDY